MRYLLFIILTLTPSVLIAEDFDAFLKMFFADKDFQIKHIEYPIYGHIRYICDSDPLGTCEKHKIFAQDSSEWEYLGYGYGKPGVIYNRYNKCPDKYPNLHNCYYLKLSEPDTSFNLNLYFKENNDSWNLIYLWYFEP